MTSSCLVKLGKALFLGMFLSGLGCIDSQPWRASPVDADATSDVKSKLDVSTDVDVKSDVNIADVGPQPDLIESDLGIKCNVECGVGTICNPRSGLCVESCAINDCSDGVCLDGRCTCSGETDCLGDSSCIAGECVRTVCSECSTDNECGRDKLCVMTDYVGEPFRMYCLQVKKAQEPCPLPYLPSLTPKTSVGGNQAIVCGPIPDQTTCEAVRANLANKSCTVREDCGKGGLCQDGRCSYTCTAAPPQCEGQCVITADSSGGFCQ